MKIYPGKSSDHQAQAFNNSSNRQSNSKAAVQLVNDSPEAIAQRKLQEMADHSSRVSQLKDFQDMANNSPQVKQAIQLQSAADKHIAQQHVLQKKENDTGLPGNLKSGIENMSGYSMDDVRVHYNSDKPAQLQAHAYAQGTDIHLGPGQEKHLAHEAWHVVQQKQGRVNPTIQMKGQVNINDDQGLEHEADVMGDLALKTVEIGEHSTKADPVNSQGLSAQNAPVQRIRIKLDHAYDMIMNNVRAARVPRAGTKEVDGFKDYDPNHRPIANDENIVLEGHGTYLDPRHLPDAPYDSQAELTPEQLANIAFMIPKTPGWHGQIVLFGCATGSLTMEVSRHYLALSGQSVNVVGTLADIKMEVPKGKDEEHRAEYDEGVNGYPQAREDSISARSQLRLWISDANAGAILAQEALRLFDKIEETKRNNQGRAELSQSLANALPFFRNAALQKLNYEGLTYGKDDSSDYEIQTISEMLRIANQEIVPFGLMLNNQHIELSYLDDKAAQYLIFFEQLIQELSVLKNLAAISERAIPEGVVDWEGDNVMNSKAKESDGLSGDPLSKKDLISKDWGKRGGGQMLMMTHQPLEHDSDLM